MSLPRISMWSAFALSVPIFWGLLWFLLRAPWGPLANGVHVTGTQIAASYGLSFALGYYLAAVITRPGRQREERLRLEAQP